MERTAYTQLYAWKQNADRKPLILNGARQVGKTWLLRTFGKQEYENTAYINCDGNKQAEELFNGDYDTER
ncbi:MAG TPA: ATPase, partial [Treponema sp.]|nr:ATPase [Treponema sp.]